MSRETSLAKTFNGLAHPRRVRIYDALKNSPSGVLTYGEIARATKIPAPSLGHHLRVMTQSKFLATRIAGPYTEFRLSSAFFNFALKKL